MFLLSFHMCLHALYAFYIHFISFTLFKFVYMTFACFLGSEIRRAFGPGRVRSPAFSCLGETPLPPGEPRGPKMLTPMVGVASWGASGATFLGPLFPLKKQPLLGEGFDPILIPNPPKINRKSTKIGLGSPSFFGFCFFKRFLLIVVVWVFFG